ncbi:hypothetical protein Tco_1020496 [Tanacetum coccineum]
MYEKTMRPRSCLKWKPTGRIFKTVGLRWVPTGKVFTSSTTTVDSEPKHGSNVDITNLHQCKQTLDVSAELKIQDHDNDPSSSKLVPNVSPPANTTDPSLQDLELLFSPMYEEYFTKGNQKPIIPPTNVNAKENNIEQAADVQFEAYEFINPLCILAHLEKKQTRLQLYTKVVEKKSSQWLETTSDILVTPSGLQSDSIRNLMMASGSNRLKETLEYSTG